MLFLVVCSCSGCTENNAGPTKVDSSNDLPTNQNVDSSIEVHNSTLKKTAVLQLENGYSLKVLDISRKEEAVHVSLRKDEQEYSTETIYLGQTYDVKDPNEKNVVYSIHVDNILENSFIVELTYILKPEIFLEASVPENTLNKVDIKIGTDTITRTYGWVYDTNEFTIECEYYIDAYKAYSQRSRNRNYDRFVTDPYDDEVISQITTQLKNLATDAGYGEDEIPYIAMTFVQSLPYVSDSVSSGYDEYPRFPFETLYNGGGDCEDSSILLASILYDMGYGVVLIDFPGHVAVGVKGDGSIYGNYYEYEGEKYFYLETTNSGWEIGQIPDELSDTEAILYPIYSGVPELSINFAGEARQDIYYTYVDLQIELENVGSATSEDVTIYTSLETTTEGRVWDQLESDIIPALNADDGITYSVSNLKAPLGEQYRVRIIARGSNTYPVDVHSDWTTA